MVSKSLLTPINAVDNLHYHQQDRSGEKQNNSDIKTELQFEIECPSCLDIMALSSSFDSLYYFCEGCDFYLYTRLSHLLE